VELIASLPCYLEENVDRVRGSGTFAKCLSALRRLNYLGYGSDGGRPLHLVYNPAGPFLPPPQASLEQDYKRELGSRYGIVFNKLYTFTNMPIGRFRDQLSRGGELERYTGTLACSFNPRPWTGYVQKAHQRGVG
jgi:radical SAM/Cys-rich protein